MLGRASGVLAKVDRDQAHREGRRGPSPAEGHVMVEFCGEREKQAV